MGKKNKQTKKTKKIRKKETLNKYYYLFLCYLTHMDFYKGKYFKLQREISNRSTDAICSNTEVTDTLTSGVPRTRIMWGLGDSTTASPGFFYCLGQSLLLRSTKPFLPSFVPIPRR